MSEHKPSKDEQDFVRVVKWSAALGLGVMAAFLYSIKQVHPSLQLRLTFGTLVVFLVTAAFSWGFCAVLFQGEFAGENPASPPSTSRRRRVRRWLIVFFSVSTLITLAAYVYSLKDVSSESRREVMEGTGIAVLVLAVGCWFIHKSVRFFEEQDRATLAEQERSREEDEDR